MTRESMLELTAEAAQGLRPILMNACLESALLRTFHETSAFFLYLLDRPKRPQIRLGPGGAMLRSAFRMGRAQIQAF